MLHERHYRFACLLQFRPLTWMRVRLFSPSLSHYTGCVCSVTQPLITESIIHLCSAPQRLPVLLLLVPNSLGNHSFLGVVLWYHAPLIHSEAVCVCFHSIRWAQFVTQHGKLQQMWSTKTLWGLCIAHHFRTVDVNLSFFTSCTLTHSHHRTKTMNEITWREGLLPTHFDGMWFVTTFWIIWYETGSWSEKSWCLWKWLLKQR